MNPFFLFFCSFQALKELDDAYPHGGGQSTESM